MNNDTKATVHGSEHFQVERLVTLRKQRGITQTDMAKQCGIGLMHMNRIEHGTRGVSVDMLQRFCDALDCSADYLLGRTNEL